MLNRFAVPLAIVALWIALDQRWVPIEFATVFAAVPLFLRRDRSGLVVLIVAVVVMAAVEGRGARHDHWGREIGWLLPWLLSSLLLFRRDRSRIEGARVAIAL